MALMRLFGLFLFVSLITFSTAVDFKCYKKGAQTSVICDPATTRKVCVNVFKISDNKTFTDATGCDGTTTANKRCIESVFPYCAPSPVKRDETVCCCNKNDCNVKTFSPLGVEQCLKEDGTTPEPCKRSTPGLELPKMCYSEFKEGEKDATVAGCDNENKKCTNDGECKKDPTSNHWICCCGKKDCNVKTFTPLGVEKCLKEDGTTPEMCKRSTPGLELPKMCYSEFKEGEKDATVAGCDNENKKCTNDGECKKDPTSNHWICCCGKKDCNVKTFTPLGVEQCLKEDGTTPEMCKRSAGLALPKMCYSEFKNEAATIPEEAGCDDGDKKCTNIKDGECKKDTASNQWICCCGKKDCNNKDFIPITTTTAPPPTPTNESVSTTSVSSTTTKAPPTPEHTTGHTTTPGKGAADLKMGMMMVMVMTGLLMHMK